MPNGQRGADPGLVRVPTGLPGLDTITKGGLYAGDIYLIQGGPGTGKTVLGNQICFNYVARGNRAAYVTLLAESHARMIEHLRSFRFFDPDLIGDQIRYVSGYNALDREGLSGLRSLLARIIREEQATFLVVDGLVAVAEGSASSLAFRTFVLELHALTEMVGCTTILLTSAPDKSRPAADMADGIITVSNKTEGRRNRREIEVEKLRGTDYLSGIHSLVISQDGLVVYPRIETIFGVRPAPAIQPPRRAAFGMPRFDAMMEGGPDAGSVNLILGSPGSGKTSIGLTFLSHGAELGEPGLYFGFDEPPARLVEAAARLGLPLQKWLDAGRIDLVWTSPNADLVLDQLAERLIRLVRERQVRRLVLDTLSGLRILSSYPEGLDRYLTALGNELRSEGVTTLMTVETGNFVGPTLGIPIRGISPIVDNIFFARWVEVSSRLRHLLSILKMRQSAYDPTIRQLIFSSQGVDVGEPLEGAQGILTGIALPIGGGSPPRRSKRGAA
jgi:circadian clock protein KaiC